MDLGTGDGAFVRRFAKLHPDTLVIGLDANAEGLRDASRRVGLKPARGGLANAIFGRMSLEEAPGELEGLADALTILLPWGSLLRAVALPEPAALARLRGLCKPAARFRIVFGYGTAADPALELPPLSLSSVERGYRQCGLDAAVTALARPLAELSTTWAARLAFSQRERRFVEVSGHF